MSILKDKQASLIIEALRFYQEEGMGTWTQGVDIDDLCEKLNVGDIVLVDKVKPLQSYHLVYSYVDPYGEVVRDCHWTCEAEDLNHAVEQLISVAEGSNGNGVLSVKPIGQQYQETIPPLIREGEEGYHLIQSDGSDCAYVRVCNIDVKISPTDEGVSVELFNCHAGLDPVWKKFSSFSECTIGKTEDDNVLIELKQQMLDARYFKEEQIDRFIAFLMGTLDPMAIKGVEFYVNICNISFGNPSKESLIEVAINGIFEDYNIEEFQTKHSVATGGVPELRYVNVGDTYAVTLIYYDRDWYFTSLGDAIEAIESMTPLLGKLNINLSMDTDEDDLASSPKSSNPGMSQ